MQASYMHLFCDDDGISRFRKTDVQLAPGFAVPPAEPLHFAEFAVARKCHWVGGSPNWKGDAPHPVPQRMLIIPIQGAFEVTAGDGTMVEFRPGDVLVAEDTWGGGHASRMTGGSDSIALFIELAEAPK